MAYEDEEDDELPLGQDEEGSLTGMRVAAPAASIAAPASGDASITGMPSAVAPQEKPESVTSGPLGGTQPLAARPAAERLSQLEAQPSPFSQRHGIGGVLKNIADVAGSALFPSVAEYIPGTLANRQSQLGQARLAATEEGKNIQEQEAEKEAEARTTEYGALGDLAKARQKAVENPPQKPTKGSLVFDKAGNAIAYQDEGGNFMAPDNPELPPDVQKILGSAKPKPEPEKNLEKITVVGPDQKPHVYGVNTKGERVVDYGLAPPPAGAGSKEDARSDKSYQFNSTQLEKERVPIEAQMGKISAATSNIDLKSPQADALLAPQVLSLSAGGAGSGLRMNEAEISRILGGRTAWETLKANLNKWSTDPNHPQIPTEQRQQMVQILQAAQAKGIQKQHVLEWAEGALVDASDPKEHRSIVQQARKFLDAVDQGKQIQRNKNTGEIRIAP